MKRCDSCGNNNLDSSQYCDECGTRLVGTDNGAAARPAFQPNSFSSGSRAASVTSIGIPPLVEGPQPEAEPGNAGDSANTVFSLSAEESNIGRWDADNGIFPDVDLDAYDPDAKVSRRHARIVFRNNVYMIEDLGSTNGTFINRGRRLLPGSPQVLTEGDEIIVGKTFLRFHINN
jgi:pSer/pThr/pTyr-binding forkhead associated (FHA) protein